jgi:hypothetical protein
MSKQTKARELDSLNAALNSNSNNLPKNFRSHPDIENFFRFIYENDLREESLMMLDEMLARRDELKAAKKSRQQENLIDQ